METSARRPNHNDRVARAPMITEPICYPINDKATRYQGGGETRNGDGSGNGLGVGADGDPSPTITAADRHIVCAAFMGGQGVKAGGIGYAEEQSPTLKATLSGGNTVPDVLCLDMTHACDVIRDCGEIVPSLQARMGTGGNQVPLVMEEKPPLYIVRRLTPLECERLQGYQDGWTDIGEWVDSKGKHHKDADSPRYKALGNSIALPFWRWMLSRMAEHLPGHATMASLFDGIGGFPTCWEAIHGNGTALWASEIEEFPIAVTKTHF